MTFTQAIASGFQNYVTFRGRAPRSEYWYWVLFVLLVSIAAGILDAALFPLVEVSPLVSVAGLLFLLPGLAVSIRRLHDLDRSGWWYLILFIPLIGWVVLIIWACMRGTVGANRFGPDPLAGIVPVERTV